MNHCTVRTGSCWEQTERHGRRLATAFVKVGDLNLAVGWARKERVLMDAIISAQQDPVFAIKRVTDPSVLDIKSFLPHVAASYVFHAIVAT